MKTILNVILLCTILGGITLYAQTEGKQKAKRNPKPKPKITPVSFKNHVMPVFRQYCLPCHTEDQMNPSELYLDSYDALMNGGKHGKSIIAGKADSSLVIKKLGPKPPFGDPMPMKVKTPMTDSAITIIKIWINQGAKNN